MTIYLLNTPILTSYGEWHFEGPITVEQAKSRIAQGFKSAVGHEASAQFLSQLLDVDVTMNRISINMQADDEALVLRIKSRLPEGKLLTHVEIANTPYELGWLRKVS
jgi:hypothetical protein